MKYRCKNNGEDDHNNGIWDAFVDHLNSVYFSGASEVLDKQTIAFEYDCFMNDFAWGHR